MPVFIGNFRSGTTLLANLLGLHPQVTPWFETKALCEPLRWLRVLHHPETFSEEIERVRPAWISGFSTEQVALRMKSDFEETLLKIQGLRDSGKGAHERYPIGADHMLASLDECLIRVDDWAESLGDAPSETDIRKATGTLIRSLGALECTHSGKPLWINKTPEIPRFASELRACLGPTQIILVIRDGRDVVRSAAKLGWASEKVLSRWWKDMILESRSSSENESKDYLEIRYEELIENSASTLRILLRFLQLDGSEELLIQEYNKRVLPEARLSEGNGRGNKKNLNSNAVSSVPEIDMEFLRSLGYPED